MAVPERPRPEPEEARRVAASYRVDVRDSDRLRLVPFGTGLPAAGEWRSGLAVGDMNGDGHRDVVLPTPRKSPGRPPLIFLGDGKGTWRRWAGTTFPPLAYDYGDVQVGDIDGDGHQDLALAMHLRGLVVLLGDGRGRFRHAGRGLDFASKPGEPLTFSSQALRLVPWSGDRRLDILALGEGPAFRLTAPRGPRGRSMQIARGVALYLNQGDGSWVRRDHGIGGNRVFGDSLVLGDFAGDGRPGFATSSSVQGRKDLINLRTPDGGWETRSIDLIRPMAYVTAVAAADFAGRGRADLATAYLAYELETWRAGVDVFSPQADGSWTRRAVAANEGRVRVTALAAGDVDGDGRRDLVALTGRGEMWIFLGDGGGSFTREKVVPSPFGSACGGASVELADLDGDGRDEIVAAFAEESAARECPSSGGVTAWRSLAK
jgi:hypothetical protein